MDADGRGGGWVPAAPKGQKPSPAPNLFSPHGAPTYRSAPARPAARPAARLTARPAGDPAAVADPELTPAPRSRPQHPPAIPAPPRNTRQSVSLSTVLQYTRPATWHRPARRGSGPVRSARLAVARYRRPLSACLVLTGVWVAVRVASPAPQATVNVVLARRDLPAGQVLAQADLRVGRWPAEALPAGQLSHAAGRVLASPIRAGEPLTDARVVGPGLLAGQASGTVAVPVRLSDATASALVRAGDRVDVLVSTESAAWSWPGDPADSTDAERGQSTSSPEPGTADEAERIASSALVLAALGSPGGGSSELGSSWGSGFSGSGFSGSGRWASSEASGGRAGFGDNPAAATTAYPDTGVGTTDPGGTGLLVLAVSPAEARRLAAGPSGRYVGIVILQPQTANPNGH